MNAKLVAIGDEILIGQTLDSNTQYIAKCLTEIGIDVESILTISDCKTAILRELKNQTQDIVIFTGGLGPTKDDITKKTMAEFFNVPLVLNEMVLENVKQLLVKVLNKKELNELNIQQAYVPKNAKILLNKVGTASGMWFSENNKIIISMPGVPFEMKHLMQKQVLPKLKKISTVLPKYRKNILVFNFPESDLAIRLENWENQLSDNCSIAYLPSAGVVNLRITIEEKDEQKALEYLETQYINLQKLLGNHIINNLGEGLPSIIGAVLTQKNLTLSTAESFTAGRIATAITSVSGSSNYFVGSVIPYSKKLKHNVLHISKDIIAEHSTVCAQVSEAMAKNTQALLYSSVCISTTGVAGPKTDDFDNEIGLAFISIAIENNVFTKRFYYPELDRNEFSDLLSKKALEFLYRKLRDYS